MSRKCSIWGRWREGTPAWLLPSPAAVYQEGQVSVFISTASVHGTVFSQSTEAQPCTWVSWRLQVARNLPVLPQKSNACWGPPPGLQAVPEGPTHNHLSEGLGAKKDPELHAGFQHKASLCQVWPSGGLPEGGGPSGASLSGCLEGSGHLLSCVGAGLGPSLSRLGITVAVPC